MRSRMALLLELGVVAAIVAMLSGCFGDAGSQTAYDGTWIVQFNDATFTPPAAASGATVACFLPTPLATVTLVNGIGTTSQINYCTGTTAPGGTTNFPYLIGVTISTATGSVSAVVDGAPLSGQCISAFACAAQGSAGTLSLIR